LIDDHEIVILPSASTLDVLREQTKGRRSAMKGVAVFADPIFDGASARKTSPAPSKRSMAAGQSPGAELQEGFALNPLPATLLEADEIMAMVPAGDGMLAAGSAATRERAMSLELREYRIVHFATHGFADDANPRMSWIALSTVDARGKPQNGFLRLLDIYNLNLSADIVVLSACSTALGRNIQGEGLVGMVRGFMYAGATRVVASLWRVDDQSTAELMKRFYRAMLQDGLSPAAALRTAQVEMSSHERWSAPYHWAAFVLQGEYR
jgi:CHAT domain-containing protein